MSSAGLFYKLLVAVVAMGVFFQTSFAAVLCVHADGSQRIEDFRKLAACHASQEAAKSHDEGASHVSSSDCTDRPLTVEAATSRADSGDSMRLALSPPVVALSPWIACLPLAQAAGE